ncbi:cation diffusion facilitator family transporter [Alkalispirochaeta americana]|uniref:Cation diffusion facilitator family transporter n=1 Tax=Alkalispirochaeta americana TaxID=159291 RepID=A0A1N6WDD7_9SPIO|nr:cation diffusion facilitator family transporter [Alkalispirochaeta americana]SIQ88163.1 cation diffusion facilitator family transporter [Alkalispirochaeta americana]
MNVMHITLTGAVLNCLLGGVKIALGILAGSRALVADGFHSLSDLITDGAVLLGLHAASRPPDDNHAFGHGRYETVSALFVGVLLAGAGVGIGWDAVQSALGSLAGDAPPPPRLYAAGAAFVSILVKEGLYQVTRRAGIASGSPAVAANAWHHRSDALSSLAAFAGIVAAALLGPSWRIMDSLAAALVAVLIIGVGIKTSVLAIREMTDVALPGEECQRILEDVAAVPGVSDPHNLKTRKLGTTVAVEVHFRVDGSITVDAGHLIATAVEARIKDRFGEDTRVITHVEPWKPLPSG